MFKSLLKKVKPLFLASLLVLAVLAILSLGPVLTYPASLGVATYYEGSTTVVKGTAVGGTSTANLDADDGVYYAVNCASSSVPQSQTLTYYSTVSDGGWSYVSYIDADDTSYASVGTKNKEYWVNVDDHTISGTITSVVIKIDCWTNADDVKEFTIGFSKDGTTTPLLTYDINCGTTQATYSWDITSSISSWTDIDNLRLSCKSIDPAGSPTIGLWWVDYHRVLVTSTATLYEVNVEHTSEQVTQLIPNITQIVVVDNFKFTATVTAHLEWYNWATSTWVNINTGSVGTTEVTWSKTWTSAFSNVISGTGYMKVRIYTSAETSSHYLFEDHLYWNVTYTLPDTTPPTSSNAGTNNTVAGKPALFHVKWTDDVGLSGFIFGTNNTGSWANDTWTPMSGATDWSNVTKTLNSTPGTLVQWRVWANDTSNNWGDTGIIATMLNKAPVAIFTESAETVNIGEVIHFNATSSYDPDGYIAKYFWEFDDGTNVTILTVDNSVSATSPYIRVVPTSTADTRLTPGSLYTVSIYTDYDGSDINSWQFTIKYNSSILKIAIDGLNKTDTWTGTGSKKTFEATGKLIVPDSEKVYVGATLMIKPDNYTIDYRTGMITFKTAPASGAQVKAIYKYALSNGDLITTAKNPNAMFNPGTYDNTAGRLELTGAFFFFIFEPAPITSGPGTLAYLTFTVVGTGHSDIKLGNETKLIGYTEDGYGDPYDIINGQTMPDHLQHGSFSNIITVDHSYASAGTYTVTLTVTDEDGTSGSVSANKTVLSVGTPVAHFTYSPPTPYTGETVTFNATTSYDPDGTIVSYAWDFGDSNKGTGSIATHSYADDGTYTVTLNVTDNDGLWDTYSADVTVRNRPPVASFTENATTVLTGVPIHFDASSSSDPDGSIANYFWEFGDGTNAAGVTVDHSYADNGTYTVTLTVTDDDGATDTATSTKTVLNRPPVASFTESATSVPTGTVIHFDASASYDPDGSIVSYSWNFGDGYTGTGVTIDHSYADNGTYTVTLTVKDNDGATASTSATKIIQNRPPVALFTESGTTVYTGEVIHFDASTSYDPDGSVVSYAWNFGDGNTGTGVTIDHSYADNGTYTVTLTVTDNDGATGLVTHTKTVLNRPPVASFTESAETVYTGTVIHFDASASYDPDGSIVSCSWNFGDGYTGTGVTIDHSYADNGTYTVTLTVKDNDGATGIATHTKTIINRPPVASFTESATSVPTGTVIHFDASASSDPDGSIVSYAWNFGDGNTGTGVTVDHSYADNGTYTVTLTVTDNDGATGIATHTKTVLNRPPVANFTESATTVYTGEVIHFDASTSSDPDGSIVSYSWNFGDGYTGTGMTIDHAYADNGTYTVTLTVTDNDGATGLTSHIKTVLNRPPVASFTESATSVPTGTVIHFDASASSDPDGSIVSYSWNFGDGNTGTGVTVDHSYADNGTYTVTLTVTDNDGATDTANATKTVLNRPPVAIFTESAETVGVGETISFNASLSYDPDGSIVKYFWNFGDGTNATGVTTTHSYSKIGNYTVTLTITDDDGATDTANATKFVSENVPPVASFTENATTVLTGVVIHFDASASYDPDGSIVKYFWDFGDGTNGTGVTIEHSYADDGTYTVTLTVTDNKGATDSANATKTVLNRSPVASFTESAETVYTGGVISFNASSSSDPDGSVINYFWDFGDGKNATGVTASHSYSDDGIYTVTLTVTDDDGAKGSANATKTVLNRPPIASFTENATTVLTGVVIHFDASASSDLDGSIASYFWNFGDGKNATGVVVNHSYADDGTYTVTLTVTDDDGATDSVNATKTVLNRRPVAIFTESAETVGIGETISFNASASSDPDGSIVKYFWNFGDSTNATGVTTTHSYGSAGTYTVTLTVTDDDGATASANATKTVLENLPPVALFTENATIVFIGEAILFNASASYDPDGAIASYHWDFGDVVITTNTASPSANSGAWTNPQNAYGSDNVYATTSTNLAEHTYYNYGIAGSGSITKVEVIVEWYASSAKGTLEIYVSWDGGSTWSSKYTIPNRLIDGQDLVDVTGATTWTWAKLSNSNFRVKVKAVRTGPPTPTWYLDWVAVRVTEMTGGTATGKVVTYSYAKEGTYTVTLTVTDNDGATDSVNATKTVLNRPPVASFTESAETVSTGEVISFNGSASYDSDGSIVGYFWDFGDGTNATGVTTSHSYADDGTYTVTLTVTDDDGAKGSANATKTVLNRPPIASFTENATTVLTGVVIHFDASLSSDPDGSIVSYLWNFGDGTSAAGVTADHSYADDGTYTVTLLVTDDDGATDTANSIKTVLNRPPVASFTENATTVLTGQVISFDASASYDPDGTLMKYFWTFGDGKNATGVTTTHSYADDGTYTVTLTVTDDDGATASVSATKTVLNRSPVAIFTESAETVYINETISFDASSSYDSDGSVVSYFWDFGDGTNATGVTTTHSYTAVGTYTVTLTVTDDDYATDTANATKFIVENMPPVALFSENATRVLTGEVISFNASASYDPDGSVVGYFWDFGDGTNATGVTSSHSYVDDGVYTVTLTVTDNMGGTGSTKATKTVLNRPPVASFTENATTVLTGEAIHFDASTSSDPDGSVVSYFWDFGDGTNATGVTVDHSYDDDGTYTVTLTVTDDDGAKDTANATKMVLNRPPVASFTENATTVLTGVPIHFDASSSSDLDGSIVKYFWDFGDGTNATGVTVDHAYTDDGLYNVTLTVTDDDGATDTATSTKKVLNRPPVALFSENATTVLTGEVISFNASSSYDPDGSIASYLWDFGDGTNATGVTTAHSYSDDGTYTVTLTVTDDDGATASVNATKTVLNRPPVAEADGPYSGFEGSAITFDASGSTDVDGTIVLYEWDWDNNGIYDESTTSTTINHTWTDDYSGTVGLRVTDSEGLNDTDTALVTVHNVAPTVYAGPDQTVNVGQTVSFNGSFTDPGSDTHTIFWDFGDGNNETGTLTPTHVYTKAGVYTVTLNVTDDDGGSGVDTLTVTVLGVEVYDIAVTSVSVEYPWGADETDGAYPGWTVDVAVTVKNNGTVITNCAVALYYHNGSAWVKIGTENVTSLAPCNNVTLRFAWSLAGVPYCNRTLKAVATLIGGVDTNPANNEGYSWVKVKMAGDVDGDGDVDADDVFMYVSPSYGSVFGTPKYDPRCDFDGDGDVDPDDVFMYLAPNYGKVYTCT